jgi:hypothetical protein
MKRAFLTVALLVAAPVAFCAEIRGEPGGGPVQGYRFQVNGQEVLGREVSVANDADPVHADFDLTVTAAKEVAGLEERNPNIFIYRIDLNDFWNLLTLFRGPNPLRLSSTNPECNWPLPLSGRSPTPSIRAGRSSSRSS